MRVVLFATNSYCQLRPKALVAKVNKICTASWWQTSMCLVRKAAKLWMTCARSFSSAMTWPLLVPFACWSYLKLPRKVPREDLQMKKLKCRPIFGPFARAAMRGGYVLFTFTLRPMRRRTAGRTAAKKKQWSIFFDFCYYRFCVFSYSLSISKLEN